MAQPFVGQIIAVGFNFAPVGWFLCDGSVVPISQYETLYTLLGTTYGGNGQTNFALPDLRGRSPLNQGQGPGLSNYLVGQLAGTESVTLIANQGAIHNHAFQTSTTGGNTQAPAPNMALGQGSQTRVDLFGAGPSNTILVPSSIGPAAGGLIPHENRQPFVTVNYIICWAGVFPSQS